MFLPGVNCAYYGLKSCIFIEVDDLWTTACYIVVQD
jgi:hypothetical protein